MHIMFALQTREQIKADRDSFWFILDFEILGFLVLFFSVNKYEIGLGLLGLAGIISWRDDEI